MENPTVERTKDLNIKDRADLKKKHNCNQCNFSTATAGSLKRHKLRDEKTSCKEQLEKEGV